MTDAMEVEASTVGGESTSRESFSRSPSDEDAAAATDRKAQAATSAEDENATAAGEQAGKAATSTRKTELSHNTLLHRPQSGDLPLKISSSKMTISHLVEGGSPQESGELEGMFNVIRLPKNCGNFENINPKFLLI